MPERANLVARIPGSGDGPRLLMLSHTDTVLADPAEWQVDPWSGELRDGEIWGRGALDMKGEVAASAVAIASLAREGFQPAGDLIFLAAADEEVGDGFGLQWLVEEHPDAVRAEYSVNEGAGDRLVLGGRVFYVCGVAEKMTSPFILRVHGRSGHASMPRIADNALVKAAVLIQRLGELQVAPRLEPEVAAFLEAVTGEVPGAGEALAPGGRGRPDGGRDGRASAVLHRLADDGRGVEEAERDPGALRGHRRLPHPPGPVARRGRGRRARCLGDADYDLEWGEAQGGTRSPMETPLWDAVASFVEQEEPGAQAVPLIVPGFTDSHWVRDAFGTVSYGFFPIRAMDAETAARLIHSADERVPVDDLELGVRFLRHAAVTIG